ncbi:MAG: hypothetical protein Q9183_003738 [Haloplaca sp. 2 TL-2023]
MLSSPFVAITLGLLTALVRADENSRLDKPALLDNLDSLGPGLLANYPIVRSKYHSWDGPQNDYIPDACKAEAENNGFSVDDFKTYEVTYDDCNTPWVLCYHKDAGPPIQGVVDVFSRLPVRTRSYVSHLVIVPDEFTHAHNANGVVVVFNLRLLGGGLALEVLLHEAAHSLDGQGAYSSHDGESISSSANWIENYNKDSNVPDGYAQSNQVENTAQNTVIAAYNVMVPGGLGSLDVQWGKIFHQYATVQTWQRESGNLLVHGGKCGTRLPISESVLKDGSDQKRRRDDGKSRRRAAVAERSEKPTIDIGPGIEVIQPKEFSTAPKLARRGVKPVVEMGQGIEVIQPKEFSTAPRSKMARRDDKPVVKVGPGIKVLAPRQFHAKDCNFAGRQ